MTGDFLLDFGEPEDFLYCVALREKVLLLLFFDQMSDVLSRVTIRHERHIDEFDALDEPLNTLTIVRTLATLVLAAISDVKYAVASKQIPSTCHCA